MQGDYAVGEEMQDGWHHLDDEDDLGDQLVDEADETFVVKNAPDQDDGEDEGDGDGEGDNNGEGDGSGDGSGDTPSDDAPAPLSSMTYGGSVPGGAGRVLGAATSSLPGGCVAILSTYLRPGSRGDQVRALQTFLNENLGLHIPATGYFGPLTFAAVKQFQTANAAQVLTPWGLTQPTGLVYKTTQRWINLMHCKDLNIPLPTDLTPWLFG